MNHYVRQESNWPDGRTLVFDENGPEQFMVTLLGLTVNRGAPGHCARTGRVVLNSMCLRRSDVALLEIAICHWHAMTPQDFATYAKDASIEQVIASVKGVRDVIVARFFHDDVSDQQQRGLQEIVSLLVIVMRMLGGFALQRQAEAQAHAAECNVPISSGVGVIEAPIDPWGLRGSNVVPFPSPKNGGGK